MKTFSGLLSKNALHQVWAALTRPAPDVTGITQRRNAALLSGILVSLFGLFSVVNLIYALAISEYSLPLADLVSYLVMLFAYLLSRSSYWRLGVTIILFMFPANVFSNIIIGTTYEPLTTLLFLVPGFVFAGIFVTIPNLLFYGAVVNLFILFLPWLAPATVPGVGFLLGPLAINLVTIGVKVLSMTHRDLIERDRTAELRASEEQFRLFVQQSSDGLVLTDTEGRIVEWNDGEERLTGISRQQVLGRYIWEIETFLFPAGMQTPEHLERLEKLTRESLRTGSAPYFNQPMEMELVLAGEQRVFVQQSTFPIKTPSGFRLGGVTRNITPLRQEIAERQRAEEALRASERNYREIFNATGDALLIHTLDGQIVDVNERMCAMYQTTRPQTLGLLIDDLSLGESPYSQTEALSWLERAVHEGPQIFEWRSKRSTGELFWSEVALRAAEIGGAPRVIAAVRDITERKQAQEALRERQQLINDIIETSQDWIWAVDQTGKHTYSNPAVERMLGYSLDEFFALGNELVHPADRQVIRDNWGRWTEQRQGWRNLVLRWKHKDGAYRDIESNSVAIFGPDGELQGFRGVDRDITERRRAEAEILREKHFTDSLLESLPGIFYLYEVDLEKPEDSRLVRFNKSHAALTGYAEHELVGMRLKDWIDPQTLGIIVPVIHQIGFNGDVRVQLELSKKDGSHSPYIFTGRLIELDGKPCFLGMGLDVFDYVQTQAALRHERDLVESIIEGLPGIFFMIDTELDVIRWNQVAEQVTGYTKSEITKLTTRELVGEEQRSLALEKIQEIFIQGKGDLEISLITKSGKIVPYYMLGWRKELGGKSYLICFGIDIADRKRFESEREALIAELEAKNAELERFTYTVSHDLKSPLITMRGFVGLLEKDANKGDTQRMVTDIERIKQATDRMQELLDDLLELSRIGRITNPPVRIPFKTIVAEALKQVEGQLAQRGAVVEVAPDLPVVYGDRARLVEVVQNLVDNAVKFLGNQPTPHITIGYQGLTEQRQPLLYVRDNGIGIDPRFHTRVFGLFDKLDPYSSGTGIGLALVKRIIEAHGGRIWVESQPGQGATFYFTLSPME